jgi:ribonuclease BN (tRNA processing enzyme)
LSTYLTILGFNSAIPTINSSPTAQLLEMEERHFLIDCGEGTQVQLRKAKARFSKINHIFISHLQIIVLGFRGLLPLSVFWEEKIHCMFMARKE